MDRAKHGLLNRINESSPLLRHEGSSPLWTQDAAEYFQHLLDLMGRAERTAGGRLGDLGDAGATPDAFRFGLETRIQVSLHGSDQMHTCTIFGHLEIWAMPAPRPTPSASALRPASR